MVCCSLSMLEHSAAAPSQQLLRCVACTPEQAGYLLGKKLHANSAAARQVNSILGTV